MSKARTSLDAAYNIWQARNKQGAIVESFVRRVEDPSEIPEVLDKRERLRVEYRAAKEAERIAGKDLRHALGVEKEKQEAREPRVVVRNLARIKAEAALRALRLKGIITEIYERQAGKCVYCFKKLADRFHVDHIIPVSRGGLTVRENLCCACPRCNLQKHDKTAAEFRGN